MEALECIKTRRSVRKFTEEAVSREQMAEVVAAAAYAPSWKNTQTARYNFVTDKEKIARLASDCMMDFAYNQKTASHAPALVILTTITGPPALSATAASRPPRARTGSRSTPVLPLRRSALRRTHMVSARSLWAFSRRARFAR